jgi:pyruvate-formate lyase
MSMEQGAEYLASNYDIPVDAGEVLDGMRDMLRDFYFFEVGAKEGAAELLEGLTSQGVLAVAATSSPRLHVEKALERNGLLKYMAKIFTCAEIGYSKHTPEIYDAAAAYMNTGRDSTLVFEDSLYALKTVVYDRGEMTLSEFKKILDENFEGNEALRLRLLRRLPKYGNDADEIDGYFAAFIEHIVSECKQYEGLHTNARLVPSVFCWIMHEYFGRKTGATPDGRKKGFPLGDGSGPCQGREQSGPTASILSSTKWSHTELIGGVAVNMKFSKGMLSDRSEEVLQSLVRVYMQRGGFELQINVTDRETLERARKDPEAYRDLIVRIGGYSDYFTRLSPEMQEEIILRTEHTI